jgi:hypothetical protein
MQGAEAMAEAIRRRRATGGPAEQTFATLVGLDLRPRRLHEAAAMWFAMTHRHGVAARDGLWNHPDLLPTAEDLDDPDHFAAVHGSMSDSEQSAFDELAQLLTDGQNNEPSGGPGDAGSGSSNAADPGASGGSAGPSNPSQDDPPGN